MLRRWSRRVGWVPRNLQVALASLATRPLRRSGTEVPPQTRWAKLPDMVCHGDDLLALYQLAYALFLPGFQSELLAPCFAEALADGLPPAMRERVLAETGKRSPLSAISVMEQRLFLGERLLRDNDVASMACSLEQRVPLVDQILFESVDRLPDPVVINRWAGKPCCSGLASAASTPRSSSVLREGLSYRSTGGSDAA